MGKRFLKYNDVIVYHTYKYGNHNLSPKEFWFTSDIDENKDNEFDIRRLISFDENKDFKEILKNAIDKGEIINQSCEEQK